MVSNKTQASQLLQHLTKSYRNCSEGRKQERATFCVSLMKNLHGNDNQNNDGEGRRMEEGREGEWKEGGEGRGSGREGEKKRGQRDNREGRGIKPI